MRVTQQVVVNELAEQGYPIDASYYRAIESGAKKSAGRELREALGTYFGRTPPSPSQARAAGATDLVEAIRDQTEAINALVAELRAQALSRPPDDEAAVLAMVEALRLGARLVVEPPAPPDGTHP